MNARQRRKARRAGGGWGWVTITVEPCTGEPFVGWWWISREVEPGGLITIKDGYVEVIRGGAK